MSGEDRFPETYAYTVPDGPKMLRETLCFAQAAVGVLAMDTRRHLDRLQRLVDACDAHRPLGLDGKHGDRHTPTCGCEDVQRLPLEPKRRIGACVEQWPECETGAYDPRCCRFPKSCSCTVYDEERVIDLAALEDE